MVTPERVPEGMLVTAEVIDHHPWGVAVRLLPPAPDVSGVVDVMYVTNERPFEPFTDYPAVGSRVQAVVMTYTPNGQLRLSTRDSDVDRAADAVHGQGGRRCTGQLCRRRRRGRRDDAAIPDGRICRGA
jgi:hypothetical protein